MFRINFSKFNLLFLRQIEIFTCWTEAGAIVKRIIWAVTMTMVFGCGHTLPDTSADFLTLLDSSQSCVTGKSQCVIAGQTICTCARAINSEAKAKVDAEASKVQCGGKLVQCRGVTHPRCEQNYCVSDVL